MPGYGFAGHIGIAPEASGAVAVAATDYFYALSESLSVERQRFDTVNIAGRYAEPDDEAGLVAVAGDIVAAAHPVSLGWFLAGVLGTDSISVVHSDFFCHAWKARTSDWDSRFPQQPFTLEMFRDVTSSQQLDGLNFTRIELSVGPNGPLQLTAGLVGIGHRNIQKTSPTFPGSPVEHFSWDAASLAIDGTASAIFEGFTITVDQQIQAVPTLAARNNSYKLRRAGPQMVRIGATIGFEDITEYLAFVNQTERKMALTFTEAASHKVEFILPRVVYTAFPLGTPGRDRRMVQIEGIARYHAGSALALEAKLTTQKSFFA